LCPTVVPHKSAISIGPERNPRTRPHTADAEPSRECIPSTIAAQARRWTSDHQLPYLKHFTNPGRKLRPLSLNRRSSNPLGSAAVVTIVVEGSSGRRKNFNSVTYRNRSNRIGSAKPRPLRPQTRCLALTGEKSPLRSSFDRFQNPQMLKRIERCRNLSEMALQLRPTTAGSTVPCAANSNATASA
jgi:hypothetical protein